MWCGVVIGNAFACLSDPKKRDLYNVTGEDPSQNAPRSAPQSRGGGGGGGDGDYNEYEQQDITPEEVHPTSHRHALTRSVVTATRDTDLMLCVYVINMIDRCFRCSLEAERPPSDRVADVSSSIAVDFSAITSSSRITTMAAATTDLVRGVQPITTRDLKTLVLCSSFISCRCFYCSYSHFSEVHHTTTHLSGMIKTRSALLQ